MTSGPRLLGAIKMQVDQPDPRFHYFRGTRGAWLRGAREISKDKWVGCRERP